jgi:uncharacterized protein YceH (UPF0502 family)
MTTELSPLQARVIGCLIEKQIATPDQYPLSLNALRSACNQKSNRFPQLDVSERELHSVVDELTRKHLLLEKSGFGSRVPKYQHLFCNTEFGSLKFTPQETAVVCELLLRGPQTPGELRSHAGRLATFHDVSEVEQILETLMTHADGPFVARLPRETGRRESRYAQLFSRTIERDVALPLEAPAPRTPAPRIDQRVDLLETTVAELRRELDELKSML